MEETASKYRSNKYFPDGKEVGMAITSQQQRIPVHFIPIEKNSVPEIKTFCLSCQYDGCDITL